MLMERHPVPVLRYSQRYLALARAPFARLSNYVDARNHISRRWLAWLGFTLEPPAPYGVARLPFHKFHMPGLAIPAGRRIESDEQKESLKHV
jgi:hypothetical protein